MRYFKVTTMPTDTAFAFASDLPSGFRVPSYKLAEGEEVVDRDAYPPNAHVIMDGSFGRALGGIIGNANSLLIVSRPIQEAIARVQPNGIQYLPLAIHNHKRRLASSDYYIVNPLGDLDCADLKASEIEYLDGDVVGVDSLVLSEAKLKQAPHLFRVHEDPTIYVISHVLLQAWIDLVPRPKNVYVDELRVVPGDGTRPGKSADALASNRSKAETKSGPVAKRS